MIDERETILGDICLAMGKIAEGCRALGLISEEEFAIVNPQATKYPCVKYIYRVGEGVWEARSADAGFKRPEDTDAYISSPLVTLLDLEVAKHQDLLGEWEKDPSQPLACWELTFDDATGKVVEDDVYALCTTAAPMFKELAELAKENG